jgi:hypothetical protein
VCDTSSCHYSIPAGPRDLWGDGLVAPYHHANKGGGNLLFRPFSREEGGSFISRACGKQVLVS